MNSNYTAIVTMIMRKENLQTVLDAMAEYLQAAVIFVSDNMDIIAFSKTIPVRDPYWKQALSEGNCSSEMLSRIYDSPFVKNLPHTSSITGGNSYPPDDMTLKYYITLPGDVFHQNITIIALPLENRFEKQRQDLLLSFASIVKKTYLHSDGLPVAYSYCDHKSSLKKLLSRDYEHLLDAETKEYARNDDAFFDNIQVLVFSPIFQEITNPLMYALADSICSALGNDYATIYNGSIVTVFQNHKMTEHCTEHLVELAKRSNSTIGISWKFSGKEQVRRHYKQATFSIEMARKMCLPGFIFTYNDMYIYALINQCRKREHWADIEHPVLSTLRDYDAKHNSLLYDTLYCLLKCGMNSTLTAMRLRIHKSTLYQRMEVLKELIPEILTINAEWQTSVMLAFDLARLKEQSSKNGF